MDTLVKEALSRLNDAVKEIPWETVADQKAGKTIIHPNGVIKKGKINQAIHALDALKAILKTL